MLMSKLKKGVGKGWKAHLLLDLHHERRPAGDGGSRDGLKNVDTLSKVGAKAEVAMAARMKRVFMVNEKKDSKHLNLRRNNTGGHSSPRQCGSLGHVKRCSGASVPPLGVGGMPCGVRRAGAHVVQSKFVAIGEFRRRSV